MKQRDNILDTTKYILILFVVLGHVFPKLGGDCSVLLNCIHLFCMPLFVMVSGYLTKKQQQSKCWKGIVSLCVTLCVFEIINAVLKYFVFHSFVPLFQPYWTLWYIFCLIIWRLIIQFTPSSILQNKKAVLSLCLAICFIAPFIPLGYLFSFQRVFTFLPFFMIGYYMSNENMSRLRAINITIPVTIFVSCMLTTIWLSRYDIPILKILRGAEHYWQFTEPILDVVLYKFLFFTLSLLSSVSILSIIRWTSKFLSDEGRKSIIYYLYHGIIIEFLLVPMAKHLGIEEGLIVGLVSTLICITICYLISKTKVSMIIADPYRYIIKNK